MSNIESPMIIYADGTVDVGPGKGGGNSAYSPRIITDHHGSGYQPPTEENWLVNYNFARKPLDEQYKTALASWESNIQKEVDSAVAKLGPQTGLSETQKLDNILKVIQSLIDQKTIGLKANQAILAKYPGVDFKNSTMKDFQRRYFNNKIPYENPFDVLLGEEMTAVVASYNVDVFNKTIQNLKARQELITVRKIQIKIEADYKASKANIEKKVQSELDQAENALPPLNNPTPEQWLERATQLVTQAIANKKKLQAANNALIAKAPNALEKQKATYNADLLVGEIASLQVRLDKLNAETAKRKEIARQAAIRAANTYAMPANGNIVVTAAGRGLIQVAQGAASLAQAISDAIAALGRVLASAPSVMAVGFASLTYSSRTAEQWQDQTPDSVRYALGMDASKLGLPSSVNLNAVAKAGSTVDLPMRLTNEARGNTTTLSVVSTDGVSVPKAVPVRMAAYNAATGLYEVTVPSTVAEAPPLILTWTPASPPGNQNPSSTTPVVPKPVPVYEGATLTPMKAAPETYPGVITLPDDLIIGFPADSGIKPIYVMFNSPYGETNARGKYSGRDYNTEKAGGPILDLDWRTAKIDRTGVDKVKLHTGRFGESPENKVMIDRLERILKGELQITDTDKRFYTHEIRELERYRNLGIKDGEIPENYDEVWNNTHSATLEDYKIDERKQPLYTPEADEAYFKSQEGK
ncbi:TPA: S-type pyocin domain-containing protein [Pseudomonas aeruginosa]